MQHDTAKRGRAMPAKRGTLKEKRDAAFDLADFAGTNRKECRSNAADQH
jgi:hypothetical protein